MSGSGTSSSKKRKLFAECKIQGDGLDVDNDVIDEIVCQKVATQASKPRLPPPKLGNLTKTCTKFWVTGSKNDLVIKKLKSDCEVRSICEKFYSLTWNEEILKSRNIHSYHPKKWQKMADLQNFKIIDSCHKHC